MTDDEQTIRDALPPLRMEASMGVSNTANDRAHFALDRLVARAETAERMLTCPYCAHSFEPQDGRSYERGCPGCARAETAERERDEWHRIADENLDRVREADLRAEARVAALEAALGYLARSDSWEIVGSDAEADLEGCSLQFTPPPDSDRATPWKFARAALAQPVEEGTS